jgi:DNA-binding transcriptional LysR family regulator
MSEDLSWDEFRLVKAISDSRSLGGAARRLGLNHSTVFRRLAAIEAAVGARLFERSRAGYEPTEAGSEMVALAETMADSIVQFERSVAGRDGRPTGELRVTTVHAIGQSFLPAIIAQFHAQNPGVIVELILSREILNLSRREADVAIRLTNEPPETLIGRRICWVRWALYRRRDLVLSLGASGIDPAPFVGFGDQAGPASARRWIAANIPPRRIAAKVNSIHAMHDLVVQGLGWAVLPCFLGERSPALIREGAILTDLDIGLWILTHTDLRRSARVRVFMDFAAAELGRRRREFEDPEGDE